ncbi:MAG TPA: amino acid permease [Steroidobacteraceae bacterium]|jgi:GABA permease|nr:amino acid permease [Steroidobacteraceae bacterium]
MNTPADSSGALETGASTRPGALAHDQVPELSRTLRPRHVTMISLGGIIGAGLFVGSSVAIAATGPMVIVTYALTGLMVLIVMRCLGEMAVSRPDIRSFTEFARAGFGHWAGFTVGWLYWYFWIIVIPVEAIAGAVILQQWFPGIPKVVIGTVLMGAMTLVNLMSTRSYAEFEFWFASIKVTGILVFIAVCAAFLFGAMGPHQGPLQMWNANGGLFPKGPFAIVTAVTTVFFSMMGSEIATIAAVESPDPARAVARMVSSVVGRILMFYLGSIAFIVCIVPWNKVPPGVSPFVIALDAIKVPYAAPIMTAIILTAVLSCLNSSFYVVSRVLFVLAARGDAPRILVRLNSRRVPARSVLIGSVAGFVGILAHDLAPSAVFAFLVNASGALIVVIYGITCAAQIRLRLARQRAGLGPPELRVWLFPWASYAAIAAMALVLVAMALDKDMASQFWASVVSIAVAFAAYLLFGRRSTR